MVYKHYSTAGVALGLPWPTRALGKQVLKVCLLSVENTISFESILMEVMHV